MICQKMKFQWSGRIIVDAEKSEENNDNLNKVSIKKIDRVFLIYL